MSRGESGFVASTGMFCPKKTPRDSCLGAAAHMGGPYWSGEGGRADYKAKDISGVLSSATAENGRD